MPRSRAPDSRDARHAELYEAGPRAKGLGKQATHEGRAGRRRGRKYVSPGSSVVGGPSMVNDASSAMQGGLRFVAQPVAARLEIHREPFVGERFRMHPNVAPPQQFSSNSV